jgi:hypothetical protein
MQSKVVNKQAYDIAQAICQSALCRVTSEPVTTKAYHLYHAYPDLNDDIILKIGAFLENSYADKVEQELAVS